MTRDFALLRRAQFHVVAIITFVVIAVAIALMFLQAGVSKTTVGGLWVGPARCASIYIDQTTEECNRLMTFGRQLLDQSIHAPVASVRVYQDPSFQGNISAGFHDPAIVAFSLSDLTETAFYVSCGAGVDSRICWDLRPLKPGEPTDQAPLHPDGAMVP